MRCARNECHQSRAVVIAFVRAAVVVLVVAAAAVDDAAVVAGTAKVVW